MSIHRIIVTATYLNQRAQNVLHFQIPDGSMTDAQITDEIKTNWVTQLKALQNSLLLYQTISTQRISGTVTVPSVLSIVGYTGDLVGPGYHPCIAGIFSIRTATAGRHGRGRFYLGGIHGATVLNGIYETNAFAAFNTKAGLLQSRYKSGGTGPMTLGVMPPKQPGSFTAMSELRVMPTFGIQRRRNIGVGV
jgi:hypothetical protein